MVQIGNEITPGMLWNDGRVGGNFDTPQQWRNLGELLKAGVRGVRESCDAGDSVRIMIHLDRGGDNAACRWYFNNLMSQGVEFDVIGLSYYPWWHGTLNQVRANLNDLAARYSKDLIIMETAYP
jgi:arabinogalactan endo-1,4-beta-galactosidase